MPNIFDSVQQTKPNKNQFNLSHDVKLSGKMGQLIPTLCMETVPGDSFNIGCDSLLRFAPLVAPVMHRMDVTMHYFFVPNRLLWSGWEAYITQNPFPGNPIPAFPFVEITEANYTPLCDYLGIPTPTPGTPNTELVSALPFAAYQLIYNEYYRDQNLQENTFGPQVLTLSDGSNIGIFNTVLGVLHNRCWEHDYFTAALPFAQKGSAVSIPLGDVKLKDPWPLPLGADAYPGLPSFKDQANAFPLTDIVQQNNLVGANNWPGINGVANEPLAYDPANTLEVEATTINDLRRAFKLQEWLEKAARGGSRYIENIKSFFGVSSSDKRLNRPEYITGTKSPVIISEVLNTTGTDENPQGNMAGHAVSVTNGKYGNYFCEEHGYIMGIMSVMPKTAYQQGIPKHFLKTVDAFQLYWPQFAHLGEQEILNKELYAWQPVLDGNSTFGYIPRYAEYKYMPNRVAGEFRDSLDFWHMGRKFAAPPALNDQFVEADPTTRIFAVTDAEDQLYVQIFHKVLALRPMPKFGTPTF